MKKSGENESLYSFPDTSGHFGIFGGKFVSETLMSALAELEQSYSQLSKDDAFLKELNDDLKYYVGRSSPLYFAERLTQEMGGARI
ncbi:MAG TPA: tryptophan synthase subunit beta, partial [Gammaproteobacteria bacterium]|nr:tryptophan synthase subunit beta [Gammaproteobacteria bacterium]